jgi:hypothetical protein
MKTDDITYNQASGKLYQGGMPLLNKTFTSELEAEDYLNKAGLKLLSVRHPESLSSLQPQAWMILIA